MTETKLVKLFNKRSGQFQCKANGEDKTWHPNTSELFTEEEAKALLSYPNVVLADSMANSPTSMINIADLMEENASLKTENEALKAKIQAEEDEIKSERQELEEEAEILELKKGVDYYPNTPLSKLRKLIADRSK